MLRTLFVSILSIFAIADSALRADWPEFRGAFRNGHVAPETGKEDSQ
jgi:hypothetical protein